jgi:SAM-dependent methyltransferase
MNDLANSNDDVSGNDAVGATRYHKGDFWRKENLNYGRPHYRLEKSARIVNGLAGTSECSLLDVGCGPAALARLLNSNIKYHGIDIAIQDSAAPNLMEADLLETPIRFGEKRFDIVLAQGFFEYAGGYQPQKLAEIARLLNVNGRFVVSYVNFGHRNREIYWLYNNVQPLDSFRESLSRYFKVNRYFPTSHNWGHAEPNRRFIKTVNMHINMRIPVISPILGVEYFFICSRYLWGPWASP